MNIPSLPPLPSISIPSIDLPSISLPDINLSIPNISIPKISLPNVSLPDIDLPDLSSLGNLIPNIKFPKLDAGVILKPLQKLLQKLIKLGLKIKIPLIKFADDSVTPKTESSEVETDKEIAEQKARNNSTLKKSLIIGSSVVAGVVLGKKLMDKLLYENIKGVVKQELIKYWYIGRCARDYSIACPVGWSTTSTPFLCHERTKNKFQNFENFSPMDKELFAVKNKEQWQCDTNDSLFYPTLKVCPDRWVHISSHDPGTILCVDPYHSSKDYSPPLLLFSQENKFDASLKLSYQRNYGVTWSKK